MELTGLKRGLNLLTSLGFNIKAIITDRHLQINKFLRETYPAIRRHYFDVWHVAKGSFALSERN